jgi:hypothetical protein
MSKRFHIEDQLSAEPQSDHQRCRPSGRLWHCGGQPGPQHVCPLAQRFAPGLKPPPVSWDLRSAPLGPHNRTTPTDFALGRAGVSS